ncbi:YidH family protein [Leptolyngbya ohadii]|uniref:YidH family protein n=1 Tax=Leptolyngbya ohadii TaxID=1962290 RepID=UPI000B5984F6|nr:DUF202 domain-containing protein [Leptolyngbya ohadii]
MSQPPKIDRQREHQANERTFLAWVRTSIALISFGLAIARFGLFLRELQQGMTQTMFAPHPVSSQTIGLVLVVAGMVMIVLAAWSYNQAFWQIERGSYKPNRWIIWITTLVMLAIGALSLPFVLWQPPASQGTGQRKSQIDRLYRQIYRQTVAYRPGRAKHQGDYPLGELRSNRIEAVRRTH